MAGAGLIFQTTTTGLSTTAGWTPYYPDVMRNPFNIGIGCVVNSSTVTYNVEHSFDDYTSSSYVSSAATWFTNSGITAKSTNQDGNYAYPVRAIRLNVTAGSSTGTVTMTLIQAF